MTTKRGKMPRMPQKFNPPPRKVKRVDGWETSDGKMHDHPVKAAAYQAELDLFRLVFHFIDVEEAVGGSEDDAKRAVRNLFKEYRDELAQLSRAAYMTPEELDQALDRHAGASGQSPIHDPMLPPISLRSSSAQLFTEFNAQFTFEAGFAACNASGGGNARDAFTKWWKSVQPKKSERGMTLEEQFNALPDMRVLSPTARMRIENHAEVLFENWRKQHPVMNYDEIEPWSKQSTTERSRFINGARRELME